MLEQADIPLATKHPVELDTPQILCSELPTPWAVKRQTGRQSECFLFRSVSGHWFQRRPYIKDNSLVIHSESCLYYLPDKLGCKEETLEFSPLHTLDFWILNSARAKDVCVWPAVAKSKGQGKKEPVVQCKTSGTFKKGWRVGMRQAVVPPPQAVVPVTMSAPSLTWPPR